MAGSNLVTIGALLEAIESQNGEILELLRVILLRLAKLEAQQNQLFQQEKSIMADIDVALAALKKIDDATTQQAATLATEATNLATVSNNLDSLLANAGNSIPPAVLSQLQAEADKVDTISGSIQKNSDFSAALATKGAPNPVPVPVPTPTPVVVSVTPAPSPTTGTL